MAYQPALPGGDELEPHRRHLAELAFQWHARIYVLVNLFLVAVWTLTSGFGYFWPVWPMLGWGVGLGVHGMATYSFPRHE